MLATLGALLYIAVQFAVYTLLLRHLKSFTKETTIFLFQLLSFLALPPVLFMIVPPKSDVFATLVAVMSLHGIYSLSFLELWSLSEGSYSLRMLDRIDRLGSLSVEVEQREFEQIGAAKKSARIATLGRLKLVCLRDGRYVLTSLARIPVGILRLLVRSVNIKGRIG